MADNIQDDALDLLREVRVWRLVGDRWHAVDQALGRLAAALDLNDAGDFR